MTTILSASQARRDLFPLIAQVNDDCAPIHITSRAGNAVLVPESTWNSIEETMFLLRSPANARRLRGALDDWNRHDHEKFSEHQLIDPDGPVG
jgi:antitoxin YefM